jgi:hypothetical protein
MPQMIDDRAKITMQERFIFYPKILAKSFQSIYPEEVHELK